MEILTRNASVRERVRMWREGGQRVALVPTQQGSLHKGHLRLVAEAQERADRVIVVSTDREFLQKIAPDVVFAPPVQELFPFGRDFSVNVTLPSLTEVLRGIATPEALSDALTTTVKLLNVVEPDCVVLGEQDYCATVVVRRMIEDLFLQVEVVECATFRDSDGVAFSGAYRELTPDERQRAKNLYGTLWRISERLNAGERDLAALLEQAGALLINEGIALRYLHIRDAHDLGVVRATSRDLVILAATSVGNLQLRDALRVHLIDRY